MRIYIKSSLGTKQYGNIGKGWQESKLIADRENCKESDIITLFKSLLACDAATQSHNGTTIVTPKKATSPKSSKAKTATKK